MAILALVGASPLHAEPSDVRPDVEVRHCPDGVDYHVRIGLPAGPPLAAQLRRARGQAARTLTRHLFGARTASSRCHGVPGRRGDGDQHSTLREDRRSLARHGIPGKQRGRIGNGIRVLAVFPERAFPPSYTSSYAKRNWERHDEQECRNSRDCMPCRPRMGASGICDGRSRESACRNVQPRPDCRLGAKSRGTRALSTERTSATSTSRSVDRRRSSRRGIRDSMRPAALPTTSRFSEPRRSS